MTWTDVEFHCATTVITTLLNISTDLIHFNFNKIISFSSLETHCSGFHFDTRLGLQLPYYRKTHLSLLQVDIPVLTTGRHTCPHSNRHTCPHSNRHTCPHSNRRTCPHSNRHTCPHLNRHTCPFCEDFRCFSETAGGVECTSWTNSPCRPCVALRYPFNI